MSIDPPPMNSPNWAGVAVVLLAAFTAALEAYSTFQGNDARQNDRLRNIEIILCVDSDARRAALCQQLGVMPKGDK